MNFEHLTTDRLILRKVTQEVLDQVFSNLSESDQQTFFGNTSPEDFQSEKDRYEKGYSTFNKTLLYFQIIDKNTKAVIGWCGYHTWYVPHSRAEIGYMLYHEKYMGQGIMSEAIIPIIKYGFEQMNLNRIEAFVGPTNTASLALMKKLGFIKEGHLRRHYFKNNQMEDSIVFGLLREEF
ncbi:MAG: GNAT family N-acetyltransferase [Flavobacteriales bacterium]|nr:GNAT family N-acetyltransferase [Flavobacteriales bacterium]